MAYAFPELDISEIPHILLETFNLQVSESFLKTPDSLQWQRMLAHMLCVVTECPEDSFLKQPSVTAEFEFVELHTDSIPVMHLVLVAQYVMPEIGCHDFNVEDIFKPTLRRVKRTCSALVNFFRFRETRLPEIDEIKADSEKEKETYVTFQNENEKLKQRLNEIKRQRAEQEPELKKIRDELEEIHGRVNKLMQKRGQTEKSILAVKTKVADNIAKADSQRSHLLKRKNDVEMMSQKVVQSPTKVRAEQDGLNKQIEMLKDTLQRKQQRLGELSKQVENYQSTGVNAEKGIVLLEVINSTVNKENEIQKECNLLEDKAQDLKHQEMKKNTQKSQVHETNQTKQEKLARLAYQHQSRMKVVMEQVDILKKEKDLFMDKQDSVSALKANLTAYQRKLYKDCRSRESLIEEKTNRIKDLYSQMLTKTEAINTHFGENWERIRKELNELDHPSV